MNKAENAFEKDLDDVGLMIVPAGGDGNCLFRAIAFQAYGDQKLHKLVRQRCVDYIHTERKYFNDFIEGGVSGMDEYLARKCIDGTWGDDIEI